MDLKLKGDKIAETATAATLHRRLGGLSRWVIDLPAWDEATEVGMTPLLPALGPGAALTLTLRERRNNLTLAEGLHLVGGGPVAGGFRAEFSEALIPPDDLIPQRRLYTARHFANLQAFFQDVSGSVRVSDGAGHGLNALEPWVLVQDGISRAELALRVVASYQARPDAAPVAVTGRRSFQLVPTVPAAGAAALEPGYRFDRVEPFASSAARSGDAHASVPIAVLTRQVEQMTWGRLNERVAEWLGPASDLPWAVDVRFGRGRGAPVLNGVAIWVKDEFRRSRGSLRWIRHVGVRPDGWPHPTAGVALPPTLLMGAVLDHAELSADRVDLKVPGFEPGFDQLPLRLLTPYSGTSDRGGLHLKPEPDSLAAGLVHPLFDHPALYLGNVRAEAVDFASPSVNLPAGLALAAAADWTMVGRRSLALADADGKFRVGVGPAGLSVRHPDLPTELNVQTVGMKSAKPIEINGVKVEFK